MRLLEAKREMIDMVEVLQQADEVLGLLCYYYCTILCYAILVLYYAILYYTADLGLSNLADNFLAAVPLSVR